MLSINSLNSSISSVLSLIISIELASNTSLLTVIGASERNARAIASLGLALSEMSPFIVLRIKSA